MSLKTMPARRREEGFREAVPGMLSYTLKRTFTNHSTSCKATNHESTRAVLERSWVGKRNPMNPTLASVPHRVR